MSAESSFLTMDTSALQETVGQMCAGHDRLGSFLRSLFGDLEALADEMLQHGRRVDAARQEQDRLGSEREERLGCERQQLDATVERLQDLTNQLGASSAVGSGDSEQLREIFAGMQEERSSLQNALAASESHGADLARMADELAAARQDLAEAREELRSQRELLAQVPIREEQSAGVAESQNAELARMADELSAARQDLAEAREEIRSQRDLLSQVPQQSEGAGDREIHDRLAQMEQEKLAWTQERAVLETELDTVRDRAAELSGALDEERQRAQGDRKGWTDELRQMRQMLQSLSEQQGSRVPDAGVTSPVDSEPSAESDSQDPVLDSVMAQFEILQKDLARRRKAKPASK